ncbi:MAG: serine hydrolase [Pirellulaceae bacterium]|jgi:CubicO group peptidase (beta-lactamase class C family)|nr:serine hydrolase [Pirellulaceae bacterium]
MHDTQRRITIAICVLLALAGVLSGPLPRGQLHRSAAHDGQSLPRSLARPAIAPEGQPVGAAILKECGFQARPGDWPMGPFVKHPQPVLLPRAESTFDCPVLGKEVRWEEQNVYNPAAVVRDGKVYLFYRADDRNPSLAWGRTCRIGMAWSEDGIHFTRHPTPVVYPDHDAWKSYEWEGGCEDLHIVEGDDGAYYMNYTTWNGQSDTLSVASSRDLVHWTKHGPAFAKAGRIGGRSGVVVSRLVGDRLVAAKIAGKYWMYYTHPCALAWSENLLDWTPTGEAVWPDGGREAGALALLGDHGILLMTQGRHPTLGTWVLRQALIDRSDLRSVLQEQTEPFLHAEFDWEKSGFTDATTVANTLVPFQGRWFLYYGAGDRCVGLAVCAPQPGATYSLAPPSAGEVLARATAELHRAVHAGGVAGAAHLVVRDGKTLYAQTAGLRDIDDGTPFNLDSILRIYSMSKPITSVAAMTLFDQRKFGLDDPVARYIPAFANATVLETDDGTPRQVSPHRPVTVRDVLRHTTGYSYGDEPTVREFYERAGLRYRGPHELFPPSMSIAQAAEALARVPALHHPGEKFTYGFSTDLLGRLIEVWSGEPLDRYLQRAVLEPLQMVDTGFVVRNEQRERFASCYTLQDGELTVVDPADSSPFTDGFEFLSGGGGLVSTVRDYANFCQMLLDGGQFQGRRVLEPETLQLMFTNQLDAVDGQQRFGLGFAIDEAELGPHGRRRKVTCYRWGGYASTQFVVVPEARLVQVFALQQLPYTAELAQQQFEIIHAALDPPAASNSATPPRDEPR